MTMASSPFRVSVAATEMWREVFVPAGLGHD
jgi:hypothetical protein